MTPDQIQALTTLRTVLAWILDAERALDREPNPILYAERHRRIFGVLWLAQEAGFEAGIRVDPEDDAWATGDPPWLQVVLELPSGQIAFRVPPHRWALDTASTTDRRTRIDEFLHR